VISETLLDDDFDTSIRKTNEVKLFELQKKLSHFNQLIEEVERFKTSNVYSLLKSEFEKEYQRYFREATSTDEAHIAKASLDKMKGVGFSMGALDRIGTGLADEADALMEDIKSLETEI
jgi:hypothetical protein